jgi:hypothetical protein
LPHIVAREMLAPVHRSLNKRVAIVSHTPRTRLLSTKFALFASASLLLAQMAWHDPRYVLPFVGLAVLLLVPAYLARRRMRDLLISGDVKRVLGSWQASVGRVMYPETMTPLMAATAYASYGWIDAGRTALNRAEKGPAWDAALEQRLFVEALLDTFEGERERAIEKAEALEQMPLPPASLFARRRIASLRRGVAALTRAFAHASRAGDAKVLKKAASASPLVHWAMRYALAIVEVDKGQTDRVGRLLEGAPSWPDESAFRTFHDELLAR